MSFTKEQKDKIAAAVNAKTGVSPVLCPVCHTSTWSIGDDLVRLTLQPNPMVASLGGPSYPLIPLICTTCGNTQLLNVLILGLADVVGLNPAVPATLGGQSNG